SLVKQCELLGLSRSGLYYQPQPESELNLLLMRMIDEQYMLTPFYGVLRMTAWLRSQGIENQGIKSQGQPINPKRVRRLMRKIGLEAIYPRPRTTVVDPEHRVYPYLLRNVT